MNETLLVQFMGMCNQAAFLAGLLFEGAIFDWETRGFWTVYLLGREGIKVPVDFGYREHKLNNVQVAPIIRLAEWFKQSKVKDQAVSIQ